MRQTFLALSGSEMLRRAAIGFSPARAASRRFVAGERLRDAVEVVAELNRSGRLATLDFLGENTLSRAEAQQHVEEQKQALRALAAAGLEPNVSLKLTAMGLDISTELALENLRDVLRCSHELQGSFVRIDMEGSPYTDRTLESYRTVRDEGFERVGVVIQTYLYRSDQDVAALIQGGARVRLCKGAYDEPPHIAFPDKEDTDKNYVHLTKKLLGAEARETGVYAALATHDPAMIEAAKNFVIAQGIPRDAFEFQMLYGIATSLQEALIEAGYRVRVYVPYGTHWYPYFMRRLAERPANVLFVLRGLRG